MKIIAQKENKATLGHLIMIILMIILEALCIYRGLSSKYRMYTRFIIIFLGIVVAYYLIKTIITFVESIKRPKILITATSDVITIYDNKTHYDIKIVDICRIDEGALKNDKMLFYQATIVIRTASTSYVVKQIKDLTIVKNMLDEILSKEKKEDINA